MQKYKVFLNYPRNQAIISLMSSFRIVCRQNCRPLYHKGSGSQQIQLAVRSEVQRAVAHTAGGGQRRQKGGERGYYHLHRNLNDSLFHDF